MLAAVCGTCEARRKEKKRRAKKKTELEFICNFRSPSLNVGGVRDVKPEAATLALIRNFNDIKQNQTKTFHPHAIIQSTSRISRFRSELTSISKLLSRRTSFAPLEFIAEAIIINSLKQLNDRWKLEARFCFVSKHSQLGHQHFPALESWFHIIRIVISLLILSSPATCLCRVLITGSSLPPHFGNDGVTSLFPHVLSFPLPTQPTWPLEVKP